MFGVDYGQPLELRNPAEAEYDIGGDEVVYQFQSPQLQCNCQLKSIERAKASVKSVPLNQGLSHRKFRFSDGENF